MRQEVMMLDCNVFGVGPKFWVPSQFQAARIVLKALGIDASLGEIKINSLSFEFLEQVANEENVASGLAKGDALSFNSAQCNKFLLFDGPEDGTICKFD